MRGDDAHKAPLKDHRHLAQVVLEHDLLHLAHRIIGLHIDSAGIDIVAYGEFAQVVVDGAVDVAAGEHAHQALAIQHRKALVAVTPHQVGGIAHQHVGLERVHIGRHNLTNRDGRGDLLLQRGPQVGLHLRQVGVLHQRGRGLAVAAAAERAQQLRHIHGVAGAAGDELHVVLELGQQDAGLGLKGVHNLVDERRELVHIAIEQHAGDGDNAAMHRLDRGACDEPGEHAALLGGQRPAEELADEGHIGALAEQPGGGFGIANGGGEVGERARVLVDAHQQQAGAHATERDPLLADARDQQRGGGAHRAALERGVGRQGLLPGVMVDDLHERVLIDAAQRGDALRVDQQQVRDAAVGELAPRQEGQLVAEQRHQVAHIAVELGGQHGLIVRVQQTGCVQRSQGVHIRAFVTGDDLHVACPVYKCLTGDIIA